MAFLSVRETRKFLEAAPASWRGRFALLIFTGIRNSEARRLTAKQVNTRRCQIDIPEGLDKIGPGRLIEGVPDCLWAWLKEYPLPTTGPLLPDEFHYERARKAVAAAIGIDHWPQNAFRHGFASYFYAAQDRNVGLVMEIMGHEGATGTFHRHYKGKASKKEGLAFCAIRPLG